MSFKVEYVGKRKKDNWEHYQWYVTIYGVSFKYRTGLGHATKRKDFFKKTTKKSIYDSTDEVDIHVPKLKDILYAMAWDAKVSDGTFEDFCSELGYSTDSRQALKTYLKCQESGAKLKKIIKSKNAIERIMAWEL